jgi:CheY-like chemotaxis protein
MTWTVLVVDDDPDIREVMELVLESRGYHVLSASSGAEALACLRAEHADLVLLDLMMPGMDGFTFRELQRRDPTIADVPVIVLSGDGRVAEKSAAIGVDVYLVKPVEAHALITTVERYLGAPREGIASAPDDA